MLQNLTPLRKSAPWPPNISDEHVFCTAPATRNASLQILFKCPTPAIVFGHATKPSRFAHFWKGAQSLKPATRNDIWTSKSGPDLVCFAHFDFEMCFAPQRRACASRHNGVHFFDISTSKSGPDLVCFAHFDIEMCFAPQRRALFRHLNFQKWSGPGVFCTFWLRNVLRATAACTISTSQFPKVVQSWCVLYILTSTCTSRHNGVHFSTSHFDFEMCFAPQRSAIFHLSSGLRTRRFREPTFRPSGATNHWKNTVFRDYPTFSRICIFFLLTLSLLWSFLFYSSLLSDFSSVHIVGSLTSKLPSINMISFFNIPKLHIIKCNKLVYLTFK